MKTIITNLEKQIEKLKKEEAKAYADYKKTGSSKSYEQVFATIKAVSKLEDAISALSSSIEY